MKNPEQFEQLLEDITKPNSTISEINCSSMELNDVDVARLMGAITSNVAVANRITKLDLSYNQLTTPPILTGLVALQTLSLTCNQLTNPPVLTGLVALRGLYLCCNQLTIPPILTGLIALRRLFLNKNQLTIPPVLTGLVALKQITLHNNQLTIPPVLTGIIDLRRLNLDDNQLTIPPILSGLVALQELSLRNNQLTIPPILTGLVALQKLNLSKNQLTILPILTGLVALQELSLGNNQLTIAPISDWPVNLRLLDLSNNQLTIPPMLYHPDYNMRIYITLDGLNSLGRLALYEMSAIMPNLFVVWKNNNIPKAPQEPSLEQIQQYCTQMIKLNLGPRLTEEEHNQHLVDTKWTAFLPLPVALQNQIASYLFPRSLDADVQSMPVIVMQEFDKMHWFFSINRDDASEELRNILTNTLNRLDNYREELAEQINSCVQQCTPNTYTRRNRMLVSYERILLDKKELEKQEQSAATHAKAGAPMLPALAASAMGPQNNLPAMVQSCARNYSQKKRC